MTHDTTDTELLGEAWGALNFILAFYDPDASRYLDTNAWKQAEASGRRVHAALRKRLDEPPSAALSDPILAARVEELEKALEEIADLCPTTQEVCLASTMGQIAIAALSSQGAEDGK